MKNLDKHCIEKHFNHAANHYDEFAVLQREVGQHLFERLDVFKITPKIILDLGAGTGYFSKLLQQKYPDALIIALDLSQGMMNYAKKNAEHGSKQQFICANAVQLPLATESIDLVFSNLAMHWCEPLPALFQEIKRVLTKNGLLLFSMAGPDTFKELRQSFAHIDNAKHVHDFVDMHDIGDLLLHARFSDPVMDMEMLTLRYPTFEKILREIQALGISNCHQQRKRGLTTPRQLERVQQQYELLRDANGQLPLSYEIIYGHAFAPEFSVSAQQETEPGVVRISLHKK